MSGTLLICLMLPLQAALGPGDSTYASARVQRLVTRAAAAEAQPPEGLTSFTGHMESEIAVLVRDSMGTETATQVEQFAGRVSWRRDGALLQRVTGYRARLLGFTLSALTYLRSPWIVAPIYGDRVVVPLLSDSVEPARSRAGPRARHGSGARRRRRVLRRLVAPFASDRAEYYRFSGGDTALVLRLPDRTVPLVRVTVEPKKVPADALVFRGDIDLDANTDQIVRMRGQLLGAASRKKSILSRLLDAAVKGYVFVDLENSEWNGSFWLPYRQRIEVVAKPGFTDQRAILRIVTSFWNVRVDAPTPELSSAGSREPIRRLSVAPGDALRAFTAWRQELGAATAPSAVDDLEGLEDLTQDERRAHSGPRIQVGTGNLSQDLHYDRVEGLFTGVGARVDLGDVAPGLFAGLQGGYAWSERTVRGAALLGLRRAGWDAGLVAERRLVPTNDFLLPFANGPTILGVLGADPFDYVDRYSAQAYVGLFRRSGASLEVKAGMVRDRQPTIHVTTPPLGKSFRPLRPVEGGSYAHVLVRGSFGRRTGGMYLTPGVGGGFSWELAQGGLNWQRVEAYLRARRQWSRWTLAGEIYGGVVFADPPPPQTLFSLGGRGGRLPGYPYKAFTGDKAMVGALQVMYGLPVLAAPVRLGPVVLPALAPSPSVEVRSGWTDAAPSTAALMQRYGWQTSEGVRGTLFLGMRFFGGAFAVGVARPLAGGGGWTIDWGLGPGV